MDSQKTFTNIDDNALVERITQATQRVVFVAPGLRPKVAEALGEALIRLPDRVTVILDVDAEVCRLGYGDEKGLEAIQRATEGAGTCVFHQPGVRIGLLIVDNDTIVYSPVPLLIEAGSTQPDKPNAIILSQNVPPSLGAACGLGGAGNGRQVGMTSVKTAAVEAVKADLRERPPKEFNIARAERVFNSGLHFVELEILNYRLSAKKVKLDAELFGLGDEYLRDRIENTFKPFDDAEFLTVTIPKLDKDGKLMSEKTESFGPKMIEKERLQIKKEFLFDIPNFGVVIKRAKKEEFEQALKLLEKRIKLYFDEVNKSIKGHMDKAKKQIKAALVEAVRKTPPVAWKKFMDGDALTVEEAERLLDKELEWAFSGVISEFNPTIRWIYKDVTYDTIHNDNFRKSLEKYFGKANTDKLFTEHDAAPEKTLA
jgi:hypothetical protein